jgi:hypothetical protein
MLRLQAQDRPEIPPLHTLPGQPLPGIADYVKLMQVTAPGPKSYAHTACIVKHLAALSVCLLIKLPIGMSVCLSHACHLFWRLHAMLWVLKQFVNDSISNMHLSCMSALPGSNPASLLTHAAIDACLRIAFHRCMQESCLTMTAGLLEPRSQ